MTQAMQHTLEMLTARRARLARELREVDQQINAYVNPDHAPFVIVRADGAVLTGRWSNRRSFSHTDPPFRFMYRTAAEKQAALVGGQVLPFDTWAKTHPQHAPEAVRPEADAR